MRVSGSSLANAIRSIFTVRHEFAGFKGGGHVRSLGFLTAASILIVALASHGCAEDGLLMGRCGDGFLDPGEDCDDGNTIGGDGCEANCSILPLGPTLASLQANIFTPYCTECHVPGGSGPLKLHTEEQSYDSLVREPLSLYCPPNPRVAPFDPAGSCLVMAIQGSPGYSGVSGRMPPPPRASLNPFEFDAITGWINAGAPR
jgi:cysteine-rich repeat protein